VTDISLFWVILIQHTKRHSMITHSERNITKKCDMSVTVIYHAMSLSILYQYNSEEWYVCHSDLPCYFSLYTVSVSLRCVICLSQWLIMPCLIVYCIGITQKTDISFTVSYHAMSLCMLYQYHSEEWYVCHWFIMLCLLVYCISITQIDISIFLVILIQYTKRHSMINHCDRHIILLSDTDTAY
jgi:hypothetical protein